MADTGPVGLHPSAREWAEALWLARKLSARPGDDPPGPDSHSRDEDIPDRPPLPLPQEWTSDQDGATPDDGRPEHDGPAERPEGPPLADEHRPARAKRPDLVPAPPPAATRGRSEAAWREPRRLAAALRPLARRREVPGTALLDEDATAEQAADHGLWLPVLVPERRRWFDLAVIIDDYPTMEPWSGAAADLVHSLRASRVFRDVHVWHTRAPAQGRTGTHPFVRDPAELLTGDGKRLFLVLSDCQGADWRPDGRWPVFLRRWAEHGPVTVAHPLPAHMWGDSDAVPRDISVRVPERGAPNLSWELRRDGGWTTAAVTPGLPLAVPVIAWDTRWLAAWASLVTAGDHPYSEVAALLLEPPARGAVRTPDEPVPQSTQSGAETAGVLRTFFDNASAAARELALHLALVPLTPDVVRAVREDAADGHPLPWAELLRSGLVRGDREGSWTFGAGANTEERIRAALLRGVRRSELWDALRSASRSAGRATGRDDVLDLLLHSDGRARSDLDASLLTAAAPALGALGVHVRMGGKPVVEGRGEVSPRPQPPVVRVAQPVGTHHGGAVQANPPTTETQQTEQPPTVPVGQSDVPQRGVHRPIPLPIPHFSGRGRELGDLRSLLHDTGRTDVLPVALRGLGGVGKTQLALKYMADHRSEYDRTWLINAEQPDVVRLELAALAPEVGVVPDGQGEVIPRVLEALATGRPVRRWLLVFDNAGDPRDTMPYVEYLMRGTSDTRHIIITSRHAGWSDVIPCAQVEVFTRAESVRFLAERAHWQDHPAQSDRLANILGDLPLALEQCAALQRTTGQSIDDFLDFIERNHRQVLAERVPTVSQPVATVWRSSTQALRDSVPGALELLRLLAFFGPEPVPLSLLHGTRVIPGLPPGLAELAADPILRSRALRAIGSQSLLNVDNVRGTVQMHRLLRLVLQEEFDDTERADQRHIVHQLLAAHDPGDVQQRADWRRYTDIFSHLEPTGLIDCEDRGLRETALSVAMFLRFSGVPETCARFSERLVDRWRVRLGEDDPQTLWAMRQQAAAYWLLSDFTRSRPLSRHVYERLRATLPASSEYVVNAAGAYAADLRTAGDLGAAKELDTWAFQQVGADYADDDPIALRTAHNYAVSLRVNGFYHEALARDWLNYEGYRALYGEDALDTLFAINNVARDRRECGDYEGAYQLQRDTLARYRNSYGDSHPHTLRAIKNSAVTSRRAARYGESLDLGREALERHLLFYGPEHIESLAAATNLANDLRVNGENEAALDQASRAEAGYRRVFGDAHPLTSLASLNHGAALRACGEHSRALGLDERSARALARALAPDHPWLLLTRINVATGLAAAGRIDEARALDGDAAQVLTGRYGERHPATLAALRNLALDILPVDEEAGEALLNSVVERLTDTLGPDHPETLAAAERRRADCDIEPPPL
ncbi:FxSxx-COOH system tetratricopeptide repeat protein [Streptomyces sp. NPDC102467]|uniref:FxSxx-COOH system tetratricopeptide repeat protein n=1 Tax=Streptomyces sp. NPDC102467 TaxID=3366179 RepID=UPI0037FD3927